MTNTERDDSELERSDIETDESADGTVRRRELLLTTATATVGAGITGCTTGEGTDTETGGTGTPGGGGGNYDGKEEEAPVTRIHTEEVEQAPDEPVEERLPPEGYPPGEEEFEELKEQAKNGELPQPPEDVLQMDESMESFASGAATESQSGITVGNEFAGWNSNVTGLAPSDSNIAIGRDKAVLAMNARWGIYDKSSGNQGYQVRLEDWFAPVIPDEDNAFVFDPKAIYDHHEDRYVLMAIATNEEENNSYWLVAVSDDANPYGTWWLTRIGHGDDENWVDYPGLGVDDEGIYLTANMFSWGGGGFQYSRLHIIDKMPFYNGNSFTYYWFSGLNNPDGSDAFTVQPAKAVTPSNSHYMVNSRFGRGDTLTLWEVENPTSNPSLNHYDIDVWDYSLPPDAVQPSTNDRLETVDARLMNSVYENGNLWTAHSVSYDWEDDSDAEAIVMWYKIDVDNQSLAQGGGWGRPDGYYSFPTIASNGETSTMMVYNESGSETNPRIEVVGRTKGYDKGKVESTALVKRGESHYDTSSDRWGDYNGIDVDMTSLNYWSMSQYALNSSTDYQWETWVSESHF